jgi:casein kinase I family protein HRR25
MLGENIVSIIQYFHFKNFVNNQVHPSNLMLGFGEKHSKLFIVDFSGASRFKDVQTL